MYTHYRCTYVRLVIFNIIGFESSRVIVVYPLGGGGENASQKGEGMLCTWWGLNYKSTECGINRIPPYRVVAGMACHCYCCRLQRQTKVIIVIITPLLPRIKTISMFVVILTYKCHYVSKYKSQPSTCKNEKKFPAVYDNIICVHGSYKMCRSSVAGILKSHIKYIFYIVHNTIL